MKHSLIDKILTEWAYRVHNGMPDPKDPYDLIILSEAMGDLKLPRKFKVGLLKRLREKGDEYSGIKGNPPQGKRTKNPDPPPTYKYKYDGGSTGKVSGDPTEGDNKVKNEMLENGYNGMEAATGTKPAPGNPGSAFNEIVSGEGIHLMEKNPNMSEQELAQEMFDQFGDSTLGQEQTQASGIPPEAYPPHINEAIEKAKGGGTLKNPDNPEALKKALKDKAVMSKCIIAARSSKQKHARSVERTKKLQEAGLMGKNTKTHTFYGAEDSKQAQLDVVKNANKVLLPNGREVNKQDALDFINAGGGGENPSDTATFVTDGEGNVMLQFHSDKMSTSDIQDNSTLAKEGENYIESIKNNPNLTEDQKTSAIARVEYYMAEMNKIEENYNDLATPIAKRLNELPIEEQVDIIEKDTGTLKKNIEEALFGKKGLKQQYEKYLDGRDPEKLTTQEKYEIIKKHVMSGEGKANDTKVVNKVASAVEKQNPGIEGLDVKKNLASQRKKVVDLQRKRVEDLNNIKTDVDGVEVGLGTLMEAEECERAFHLSLMDEHNYEPPKDESGMSDEEKQKAKKQRFKGIMDSAFDTNMGGVVVTGETLRKCTGVNNTTEMKQNFVLKEATGKDEKGRDARFTYDDKGNVTGKKVFVYAVKKGEEASEANQIGFKTYRSKTGSDGKTNNTMQYSKAMRKCFKGKK